MSEPPVRLNAFAHAGVWIDEANHGWRGAYRLCEIAVNYGYPLTSDDVEAMALHAEGHTRTVHVPDASEPDGFYSLDPLEYVGGHGGLAERCEEWMNEQYAPEGYRFGWWDGSWLLSPYCDDDPTCDRDDCWHQVG